MSPARRLPVILGLLFGSILAPAAVTAQGTIRGIVLDERTARPVPDATVRIVHRDLEHVTDANGQFLFRVVDPGIIVVETRHLAFDSRTDTLRLAHGDHASLEIRLIEGAIDLPAVTVVMRSQRLEEAGFFRRQARGMGMFFTREAIDAHKVDRLADLFVRVPGLRRVTLSDGSSRIDVRGGKPPNSRCDTQYFLDGVRADLRAGGIDGLPVHTIEGIEVYRGGSEVPTQFDHGRAMCGAVVIWTRGR